MSLDHARAVADAVLYEGYLLYPYRASSQKNQTRWQFGVLGPPGAADAGVGEEPDMAVECLLRPGGASTLTVHLRFLQLQERAVECAEADGFTPTAELVVDGQRWLSWDEAVECELAFGPIEVGPEPTQEVFQVEVPGGCDTEPLYDGQAVERGRLVRRRRGSEGTLHLTVQPLGGLTRLHLDVQNTTKPEAMGRREALQVSHLGAHLLLVAHDGEFVSLLDPPSDAQDAAAGCHQHRCWPVLAGPPGDTSVLLGSPIIVYDHPEVAEQSPGALFDSTEIDEILTLRVMTMTEEEKAEARATDPRAAEIIDRCEQLTPEQMQQMHGVLRDPGTSVPTISDPASSPPVFTTDTPWWDPESDASVHPESDSVVVSGVPVANGSLVRLHPARRADAQDLFFVDQVARVTSVHSDVDGNTHVAVVLEADPAAEMHDWYGRYLYFAPDEIEPLSGSPTPDTGEERIR